MTLSDGRTSLLASTRDDGDFTREADISELGVFHASHSIEVWFVALATFTITTTVSEPESPLSTTLFPFMFAGDDFGTLYTRRFRGFSPSLPSRQHHHDDVAQQYCSEGEEEEELQVEADYNDRARHHSAGVTSILPLPVPSSLLRDRFGNAPAPLLLTGSYDEYLRVYRVSRAGEVLAEIGLDGGVWRLQLLEVGRSNEKDYYLVLASCMHAGTRVVRVSCLYDQEDKGIGGEGSWQIEVVAEFTEHESMNYASDVWKGSSPSELLCMSSSFYDRRVCLWRVSC